MKKTELFLRKHSSTILTIVGATGVIATAALSVKATPKAMELINNAMNEKGDGLTAKEVIAVAWKPYIPAAITGISTIACIFGANFLNVKNQASLMSAYALLDNSYKEYRKKAKEIHGEEGEKNIVHEVVKSKYEDSNVELEDNKVLFMDYQSMHYFTSTMEDVMKAETEFLEILNNRGYASLNEYYDLLGIPRVEYGYQLGWFDLESIDPYNCEELSFDYEKVLINDDLECWIISTNMPAAYDYIL